MAYPEVNDKANVPELVIGLPLTLNPVGVVMATEVTPVAGAAAQLGIPDANVKIYPSDPFANKLVAPDPVW